MVLRQRATELWNQCDGNLQVQDQLSLHEQLLTDAEPRLLNLQMPSQQQLHFQEIVW